MAFAIVRKIVHPLRPSYKAKGTLWKLNFLTQKSRKVELLLGQIHQF